MVFPTTTSNFVFDDINDQNDVYIWNTLANPNSSAALQPLSVGRLGSVAKGIAEYGFVTEDARYAFFVGRATNYVISPTVTCTESLIYKVDLLLRSASAGANDSTQLLSITPSGAIATQPTCVLLACLLASRRSPVRSFPHFPLLSWSVLVMFAVPLGMVDTF